MGNARPLQAGATILSIWLRRSAQQRLALLSVHLSRKMCRRVVSRRRCHRGDSRLNRSLRFSQMALADAETLNSVSSTPRLRETGGRAEKLYLKFFQLSRLW